MVNGMLSHYTWAKTRTGEDERWKKRTRQHEETRYGNIKSRFEAQSRTACKQTYAINRITLKLS